MGGAAVDPALVERLRSAVLALPSELVAAKTCEIVKRDGKTLGYLAIGTRSIRVDVPNDGAGVTRLSVKNVRDVAKVVSALKLVAKRQTAKSKTTTKQRAKSTSTSS